MRIIAHLIQVFVHFEYFPPLRCTVASKQLLFLENGQPWTFLSQFQDDSKVIITFRFAHIRLIFDVFKRLNYYDKTRLPGSLEKQ